MSHQRKRDKQQNDDGPNAKRPRKNNVGYRLSNQPDGPASAFRPVINDGVTTGALRNTKGHPRRYTVSIAVPGSIIDNCQSLELKTYVAGQIARTAAIYNIDEIIVYNESSTPMRPDPMKDANVFLARILLYQECPQYLRKAFFPVHASLKYAGLLNPLDAPHHVRGDERSSYREGVVLKKSPPGNAKGCLVDCGLRRDVHVADKTVQPGVRVTVEMAFANSTECPGLPAGTLVARKTPRETAGLYWGYQVRLAEGLSKVFTESPFGEEYDYKVGTSERGSPMAAITSSASDGLLPPFRHLLIVFGGVKGIEAAIEADAAIPVAPEDAGSLFDVWINTCPNQGSRTIRTEEAMLLSLALLKPHVEANGDNSPLPMAGAGTAASKLK
ncbi:hypothetical protein AMAG_09112 [Allomyces macrogynus ATCC 38327]|uniref:RNA methyltransferase n=1 Tax=Allomyces macrogynus (strain ATCC 38327) TaxID=578462 RepID=A0A0L0SNU9_ALLM3|nr:hypothetical protein AMAG_09112 [Allomyces macrogynus ATCC 38327]|eukprot:KNE64054.1 hypothetical protein AMAG_09112 [Allomyces macrogynus ATCC 38327]